MNKAMMMVWWVLEVQARTHGVETVLVSFLLCNPKEPRRWLNDGLWDVGSAGGWICAVAQRPSHLPKPTQTTHVTPGAASKGLQHPSVSPSTLTTRLWWEK